MNARWHMAEKKLDRGKYRRKRRARQRRARRRSRPTCGKGNGAGKAG